jgi:hypothetical protein
MDMNNPLFPDSRAPSGSSSFEFFNVLNHTNFNAPVSRLSSVSFGLIQGAGDPCILQFAAKYSF